MGRVQFRPAATPPKGVNATQRHPYLGLHSSAPPPLLAARGPSDTAHRPRSLRLGQEGGLGVISPVPPTISLPSFQETPNHYWLRKLIVYKYPKLRTKRGWGRRKWHSAWTWRLGAGPSPSLSFLGEGPTPPPEPRGRLGSAY